MRLLWCLFLLCTSLTAHAVRVQILHTNDLHSHLEGAHGIGGYAQLATLIRTLKERAQAQGMETLVLDGGDFGEGSSFFFAHEGLTALRMLDELAIDVTVIGNHDLLQGGEELALLLRRAGLKAQVVSANLEDRFLNETHGLVKPMVVKSVAGVKIGIAGLTTSEPHYQYAIRSSGKVRDPLKEVGRVERLAKDAGVDFLIALTHIGSPRDVKLAERSRSIGLIVGAHSHERLQRALTPKNKKGVVVPVVQAGAHAMALGQVVMEIDPVKKTSMLVESQVHLIPATTLPSLSMLAHVREARRARESYFGRSWHEPIGFSLIPLQGHVDGRTALKASCWGQHLAIMARDASGAEVGLHASGFTGDTIAPGPITFGDLIDNFPHFRRFGDQGWTIATVELPGALVKSLAGLAARQEGGMGLNIALPTELTDARALSVAFPQEISYALEQYFPMLKGFIVSRMRDSGVGYWATMEAYVRRHSPLACAHF